MAVRGLHFKKGDKISKFTVLEDDELDGRRRYALCQCECGTIKRVRVDLLLSGNTKACGCLDSLRIDQIINKKYGHLTIIGEAEGKQKSVLCKCDCGRIVKKYQSRVLNGRYTSCGKCKYEDIKIGDIFGKWKVIGDVRYTKGYQAEWLCQCNCEKKTIRYVNAYSLKSGNSNGCGCEKPHNPNKEINTESRLYHIWYGILRRCNEPNDCNYKRYGARGISICQEWADDYEVFREWALNNGYSNSLSIDRIDVNGNYEPSNCRWATAIEQANNRRTNVFITYEGETHTIAEWSLITGISRTTIYTKNKKGYTPEKIFEGRK